jgi:hypothetical protein
VGLLLFPLGHRVVAVVETLAFRLVVVPAAQVVAYPSSLAPHQHPLWVAMCPLLLAKVVLVAAVSFSRQASLPVAQEEASRSPLDEALKEVEPSRLAPRIVPDLVVPVKLCCNLVHPPRVRAALLSLLQVLQAQVQEEA